jgi:hypothetical protein
VPIEPLFSWCLRQQTRRFRGARERSHGPPDRPSRASDRRLRGARMRSTDRSDRPPALTEKSHNALKRAARFEMMRRFLSGYAGTY